MELILASQSPRRRELLGQLGFTDFVIRPATGEERMDPTLSPAQLVEALSLQKGMEVAAGCSAQDIIISADTVVVLGEEILGKPASRQQATQMLQALSGATHVVYTGVTVSCNGEFLTQHEATKVHMRPLSPQEIAAYVATGEPMDKAGGYGIQSLGVLLVAGIEGDYSNVVGLPLARLARMLRHFGVDPLNLAYQKEQTV